MRASKALSRFTQLKRENSRLLREDIAQRALIFRGLPEVVNLNHSNLCNLRCIICPRAHGKGRHRLSRRALEYVTAELFPTARKAVLTMAGEPLLADFDFLLEAALRYGVKLDIVTNGTLLTGDLYRRARRAINHLNISLDSHIPEVYEALRPGVPFEQVSTNLLALRDERARSRDEVILSFSAVVMASNLPHLAGFVRFSRVAGADAVLLHRLLHNVKPTPEEEPERYFSRKEINRRFEEAACVAREQGINLFVSEFDKPNVTVKPMIAKKPEPLEGQGLCSFVAQHLNVMYTGEVYPCCVPTDLCLGNVLRQDLIGIWNGRAFRRLRAAQWSRRGGAFCSGCAHAPHLEDHKPTWINSAIRNARLASGHVNNEIRRRFAAWRFPLIYEPPPPRVDRRNGGFRWEGGRVDVEPYPYLIEILTIHPTDQSLWYCRDGMLYRASDMLSPEQRITRIIPSPAPRATALHFLTPDTLLLSLEEGGRLFRLDMENMAPSKTESLTLSDPRSSVRQRAVALTPSGHIWVGEYGIFPGARCANLYRSVDHGKSFHRVWTFSGARHVHLVYFHRDLARVLVTTGDLAAKRRLFIGSEKGWGFRTLLGAWSGFTAVAETANYLHFGTDLSNGNGLLRWQKDLNALPEFRRLPDPLDFQVCQIVPLGHEHLLALCNKPADPAQQKSGQRAPLLLSEDEGNSWKVVHLFSEDKSDEPEGMVLMQSNPPVLLTICTPRPGLFTIGSGPEEPCS